MKITPKASTGKGKTTKIKISNLTLEASYRMGKISADHIPVKGLISKIY